MVSKYRKYNRLTEYDYSHSGAYFITICTQNRHAILSKIVGDGDPDVPKNILSEYGIIVEKHILSMHSDKVNISVHQYIIMPDHVHFIVSISDNTSATISSKGTSRSPSPTNAIIPKLISGFKRFTNKEIGFNIWQRSYHDHVIRNEKEYTQISQYIAGNPARWAEKYNI